MQKELPKNCLGIVADLSKDDEIDNLYNQSIKKFNSIDILINNAGINKDALSIRMTSDQWNDVININLSSVFKLSQLGSNLMLRTRVTNLK